MVRLRKGLKKRIHVNGAVIRANKATGANDPVFTVKSHRRNDYGRDVKVLGPVRLVQNFRRRLRSGAVAWIETTAEVQVR